MLSLSQEEIKKKLNSLYWNFEVGDNTNHNLKELFYLYKVKIEYSSTTEEKRFLNKHISLCLMSILEVVLYDFIVRLDEATNHFPKTIDENLRNKIKGYIAKKKIPHDVNPKQSRVYNYSFNQIVSIFREFNLLDTDVPRNYSIYNVLETANKFRNRIHIYNWYNNFETNEEYVFTDKRLAILEKITVEVINTMEQKYQRW